MNNYEGISEAEHRAKYGTPKWPSLAFGTFHKGGDSPKTGILVLLEKEAQFSNVFGGMAHSTVICTYDLNENKVLNVIIAANELGPEPLYYVASARGSMNSSDHMPARAPIASFSSPHIPCCIPEGERPSLPHHGGLNVLGADEAMRERAAVHVAAVVMADDGFLVEHVRQDKSGSLLA